MTLRRRSSKSLGTNGGGDGLFRGLGPRFRNWGKLSCCQKVLHGGPNKARVVTNPVITGTGGHSEAQLETLKGHTPTKVTKRKNTQPETPFFVPKTREEVAVPWGRRTTDLKKSGVKSHERRPRLHSNMVDQGNILTMDRKRRKAGKKGLGKKGGDGWSNWNNPSTNKKKRAKKTIMVGPWNEKGLAGS